MFLFLVVAIVAVAFTGSRSDRPYRVAAIFDTAKGMVAGQQVKVAGAVVGSVRRVELVAGPKARLVMEVDERFGPFRLDATCAILPEGLISENFVECDPGSPRRPELAVDDGLPTVAVERTTVPTALQDVINVFSLPVDQRLRVIIDELGVATAGRGEDLNALLRRTNPALTQARRVLAIVDGQRDSIAGAVAETDRVLAELADQHEDVRGFVSNGAAFVETTAVKREQLAETVRRLPALLVATRRGLGELDRTMTQTTPLLGDLRVAAPSLRELTVTLPAFARAGAPALRELSSVSETARSALASARGPVADLRVAAQRSGPFSGHLETLLSSTRDQGGIEGLLRVAYSLAASFSAYDDASHIVGLAVSVLPQCLADATAPGCSSKYDVPGNGTIPPNDPSCGPQSGAPWDPPTDCDPNGRPREGRPRSRTPERPSSRRPAPPNADESVTATPAPTRTPRPPSALPKLPSLSELLPLPEQVEPELDDSTRPLLDFLLDP